MLFRRLAAAPAVVVALIVLAGCGDSGGKTEGGTGTPTAKEALTDLAALLNHLQENGTRAPARVADINPVEPLFPGAYLGLSRGDIVYIWGAPIDKSAAGTVLAYEKKTETDGGWVLMQDGTVKEMKGDEFKNASKAKK